MDQPMNDEEAVRRCQDGDPEAFRHVVEQYGKVLYGTAYLMTRDTGTAEDLVQEAFLSAWKGIRGFDKGRPLKPWLVRILVNEVMSYRRRRSLPTTSLVEGMDPEGDDDPAELAETRDSSDQVRRALATLSEEHQQVVILKYFDDLSVPEISTVLKCPAGTVKSRLHRALDQLRQGVESNPYRRSGGDVKESSFHARPGTEVKGLLIGGGL